MLRRPGAVATLLLAAAFLAPAIAVAQFVRTDVATAERTDAGSWNGTWIWVTRQGRMALWIRTVEGRPEVKLRYQASSTRESFETDWSGRADYVLSGHPGTFRMELTDADQNTIEGNWLWQVRFPTSGRLEEGAFTMYRAGDGRAAVIHFPEFHKSLTRRGRTGDFSGETAWSFAKASKRLVMWEELPF